jgi:hypothetical protein
MDSVDNSYAEKDHSRRVSFAAKAHIRLFDKELTVAKMDETLLWTVTENHDMVRKPHHSPI